MNDAQREPLDEGSEAFDEVDELDGFDIPVHDAGTGGAGDAGPGLPAAPDDEPDWTRAQSVRDDPESLGAEARKLWDAVYSQFLGPLVRNYPEAAGHLSRAGEELATAARSLIRGSEQLWAQSGPRDADPPAAGEVVVEVQQDGESADEGPGPERSSRQD